ncbi:hypothetical protein AGMMS50218_02790 [Actinomycetota bacterium]|nr:hypothetical protein AGMMS50218_02790 [Actinomycetota bacterium]
MELADPAVALLTSPDAVGTEPVGGAPTAHFRTTGLDDLYDIGRLAARLGVEHATVRVWLSRKVPWLPPPDGRLNGGAVWRAATLDGIEERRAPGRPGRRPRAQAGTRAQDGSAGTDSTAGPALSTPHNGGTTTAHPLHSDRIAD